jgi:hypothetical protein
MLTRHAAPDPASSRTAHVSVLFLPLWLFLVSGVLTLATGSVVLAFADLVLLVAALACTPIGLCLVARRRENLRAGTDRMASERRVRRVPPT